MKITIEIDQQDYINACTPFNNGCSFRPVIMANGDVYLDSGCYLLVNLVQGADRYFLGLYVANGNKPFKIDATPETKHELLKMPACKWCGGLRHEAA